MSRKRVKPSQIDLSTTEQEVLVIHKEHANAVYRPMTELLKQRGIHVNHMKVQRLMKKLGLR